MAVHDCAVRRLRAVRTMALTRVSAIHRSMHLLTKALMPKTPPQRAYNVRGCP